MITPRRNLWLLPLFAAASRAYTYVPVLASFLATHELGINAVLLVMNVSAWTSAIVEFPTGLVADYRGRKISMAAGMLTCAVGMLGFIFGSLTWHFMVAAFLLGIGTSLVVGADKALLRHTYRNLGIENEEPKANARMMATAAASEAACALIGVGMIALGLAFSDVLWLQVMFYLAAALIALYLVETTKYAKLNPRAMRDVWALGKASVKLAAGDRQIFSTLFFMGSVSNLSYVLVWWAPVYYLAYSGYQIGTGEKGGLYGVIWAAFLGSVYIWQTFFNKLSGRPIRSYRLFVLLTATCYLIMVTMPGMLGVAAIILTYFVRANGPSMSNSILDNLLKQRDREHQMASMNSLARTLQWMFSGAVFFVSKLASDISGSMQFGLLVAGIMVVALASLGLRWVLNTGALKTEQSAAVVPQVAPVNN